MSGVDLSRAEKGARVKFRCGGEAEIAHIHLRPAEFYGHGVVFKNNSGALPCRREASFWYQVEGYNAGTAVEDPFDIVDITPPVFDWSTVKPGMAFNYRGSTVWYIGPDISEPTRRVVVVDVMPEFVNRNLLCPFMEYLHRLPSKDYIVKT